MSYRDLRHSLLVTLGVHALQHSAITVLRRRGIMHSNELQLAPHLAGLRNGNIEYDWLDDSIRA